jgi:hypothetical protein
MELPIRLVAADPLRKGRGRVSPPLQRGRHNEVAVRDDGSRSDACHAPAPSHRTRVSTVDQTGALSETLGISADYSIPSTGIDIRQTTSAGGFDVFPFSRNIR